MLAHHNGAVGGPQFAILKKADMYPIVDEQGLSKIYRRSDLNQTYAGIGLELMAKTDNTSWSADKRYDLAGGNK